MRVIVMVMFCSVISTTTIILFLQRYQYIITTTKISNFIFTVNVLQILSAFHWIIRNQIKATFYAVTDDDILMIIPKVEQEFTKIEIERKDEITFYCGYVYDTGAVPFRNPDDKWLENLVNCYVESQFLF